MDSNKLVGNNQPEKAKSRGTHITISAHMFTVARGSWEL